MTQSRSHKKIEPEMGGRWPPAQGQLEHPDLEGAGRTLPWGEHSPGTPWPSTSALHVGGGWVLWF